jgi:hypothetical protein
MSILYKVENEDDDTENTTTDKFITKDKVSVTNNLKTQNFLEDKVMNKLLTMRGGSVEGFKELFKGRLLCLHLQKLKWKWNYKKFFLINIK